MFPTEKIQMSLIRKVKEPIRAHKPDAGIDFFVPEDLSMVDYIKCNPNAISNRMSNSLINDASHIISSDLSGIMTSIHLEPNARTLIPSGIKANIPFGWALIFFNKSGISVKKGLMAVGCVIDSGYQGEMHISLVNASNQTVEIKAGEKIIQGILLPVGTVDVDIVNIDDLYQNISSRGDGGFGSTNV